MISVNTFWYVLTIEVMCDSKTSFNVELPGKRKNYKVCPH